MPRAPRVGANVRRNARALKGAFKRRMRIRRLTSVIAPADVLTLGNAFSGFMAIIVLTGVARIYEPPFFPGLENVWPATADDRFLIASVLLTIGLVCDALDGVVARKFGGSRLGADLDTLADTISFVVVPALMILTYYGRPAPFRSFLAAGLILVMGILRLARFNSNPIESETKDFQGLPTPWMAVTVALMVLTQIPLQYGLPFAVLLAFLMMSNVAYPKSKGRARYATYLMVLSALVVVALLFYFPHSQSRVIRTAFVIVAVTIAVAPLLLASRNRFEGFRGRARARSGPPPPPPGGNEEEAWPKPSPTTASPEAGPRPRT